MARDRQTPERTADTNRSVAGVRQNLKPMTNRLRLTELALKAKSGEARISFYSMQTGRFTGFVFESLMGITPDQHPVASVPVLLSFGFDFDFDFFLNLESSLNWRAYLCCPWPTVACATCLPSPGAPT